jgi:hypothetical protein
LQVQREFGHEELIGAHPFNFRFARKGARALAAGNKSITTDKSVIFLFLFGGPSQFETFDPKMSAPDGIRSVTGEIATALPGVTFGASFPQLANRANQLAVVRSYVPGRDISNHVICPIVHKKERRCLSVKKPPGLLLRTNWCRINPAMKRLRSTP